MNVVSETSATDLINQLAIGLRGISNALKSHSPSAIILKSHIERYERICHDLLALTLLFSRNGTENIEANKFLHEQLLTHFLNDIKAGPHSAESSKEDSANGVTVRFKEIIKKSHALIRILENDPETPKLPPKYKALIRDYFLKLNVLLVALEGHYRGYFS